MNDYTFGEILFYISPFVPWFESRCVYIRDDSGLAVVFFEKAEWAARVNYKQLSRPCRWREDFNTENDDLVPKNCKKISVEQELEIT